MKETIYSKEQITSPTLLKDKKPKSPMLLILILVLVALFMGKPFIEYDSNGLPKLANWREKKLLQELDDLDGAEQYVLLTEENGIYPCFSCIGSSTIYLRKGQVWKYGMTTKGEKGRYQGRLAKQRLHYEMQFEGSIQECLKEERKKIYLYALLPENLRRDEPLIRPPGNKRDN